MTRGATRRRSIRGVWPMPRVGELAALLDIPQSPLSQHLARMRKESLVKTRREAQTIFYSIASDEAARIVALMHDLYCGD